jgi:hypothetical protein
VVVEQVSRGVLQLVPVEGGRERENTCLVRGSGWLYDGLFVQKLISTRACDFACTTSIERVRALNFIT